VLFIAQVLLLFQLEELSDHKGSNQTLHPNHRL